MTDWKELSKALTDAFNQSQDAYAFSPGSYTAGAAASMAKAVREFEKPKVEPEKAMG